MFLKKPPLLAAALLLMSAPAFADTVVTKTTTTVHETRPMPPVVERTVLFNDFDLNRDGILSPYEVSEMLFTFYDTDRNGTLSQSEYEVPTILTVSPMETKTVITYDYDNDGIPDKTQTTYENFMHSTQLDRFASNKSGLSPHDVVGRDFKVVDANKDGEIDRSEWRQAYLEGMPRLNP